jgi:hypothetical protein
LSWSGFKTIGRYSVEVVIVISFQKVIGSF